MANILGFAGIGVSGLALLLAILAIALPYWETFDGPTTDVNVGIWEVCSETAGTTTCITIDSDLVTDDVRAVRATVLLGILLTAGAIVCAVLVLFVLTSTKILFFVAAGLDVAAGLFLMVAMAVYVDKLANDAYDLGASFALDIVAWIAAWAAGGIFVGAKLMDKE